MSKPLLFLIILLLVLLVARLTGMVFVLTGWVFKLLIVLAVIFLVLGYRSKRK